MQKKRDDTYCSVLKQDFSNQGLPSKERNSQETGRQLGHREESLIHNTSQIQKTLPEKISNLERLARNLT